MHYPSIFIFDEDKSGTFAATADGRATLTIDNMANDTGLDEDTLRNAISLEIQGAEIQKNEQNGCLRIDRVTNEGKNGQTDLYMLTEHSFHHIILCYPAEEKGTYFTYIEYMINTSDILDLDQMYYIGSWGFSLGQILDILGDNILYLHHLIIL